MKRSSRYQVLALVLVLLLASLSVAWAEDGVLEPLSPAPAPQGEVGLEASGDLWFVELDSPPAADGTSLATLRSEKSAFRTAARRAGLQYSERRSFDQLWNGLSIKMAPSGLAKLSRIAGVKAVYPVERIPIPTTTSIDPDLATALAMTGADIAQSELGYTGAGVKVAVMDTGIDYDHPDLGGGFGAAYRVKVGWDFVGDAYDADPASASYNPVPVPDPDPDDCNGHGTHVAGIIGASAASSSGVTGVAPGVTFGAYRVFGCDGSTDSDIMIAAMERALADKMQVLNMSIGSGYEWPQYPTAQAATRLVNRGMVVVASIGNNGPNGLYAAGAPGVGEKVIGVASFDNTIITQNAFSISPDGRLIGYNPASAAPVPPTSGTYPMARTGTTSTTNDACNALPAGSLADKVALIRRGTCSFYQKALNAQSAGAAAVVLYNNQPGVISPTVAGATAITIPVVMISQADGADINSRLDSGTVDLTWTSQTVTAADPNGGLISSFSSYGLPPDLSLKPDLGAPGGNIWSTYPLELGGYTSLSGTSMSSPHVAGAVALLLQAKPKTPAQAVRTILQNSADPALWWGDPGLGFLDNVHRQGAGMLDIDDAILATTKVEPAKLALGESAAGPSTRTIKVENASASTVTYDLSSAPALATGPNTFSLSFYSAPAEAAFSIAGVPATSVAVPAKGSATFQVTITANPGLPDKSIYGGYVVLTPQGGGQTYRVPYAGFKGDYQSIQALTSGGSGFPLLAQVVGGALTSRPTGATFTLASGDVPYVLVHLDHQVQLMRVEVFDANTGKAWHRALNEWFLPRNSTPTGYFALPWDGQTIAGSKVYTVPDGQYVLKLSVLKALGSAANPADWETWTSPVVTIDRP